MTRSSLQHTQHTHTLEATDDNVHENVAVSLF